MREAVEQIHLERVVVVVEQRSREDGSFAAFDLWNTADSLKSTGMVDNIDVLYYSDYTPNCDEALINYCIQKKPQAVLLSLQSMASRGEELCQLRKKCPHRQVVRHQYIPEYRIL